MKLLVINEVIKDIENRSVKYVFRKVLGPPRLASARLLKTYFTSLILINMNNLHLKKKIMRRVYMLYVLGKVLSRAAFKVYATLALLYGIKIFVHVEAVANNMPEFSNLSALFDFMSYAAVNTNLAVQFLIFGIVALVVWVLRDSIKNIFEHSVRNNSVQNAH